MHIYQRYFDPVARIGVLTCMAYTESVEDEDEVLTALSDELGGFVEYVGGPEYGHVLLSPLENLAGIEEPLVRDRVRRHTSSTQPPALMHKREAILIYQPGRRLPQQNLRPTLPAADRTILHPPDPPPKQSRLVHFQNQRHRPLQHPLPKLHPQRPRRATPEFLPARPRRHTHGAP